MAKEKYKKVQGFVLHFGYVESSRIGTVFLGHQRGGFNSVPDALKNLADYLMEDYFLAWMGYESETADGPLQPSEYSTSVGTPSLEQFQYYLDQIPFSVAAAGPGDASFDSSHVNDEEWWAWHQVHELYPYFEYYYENIEAPLCSIMCHYLTPDKIPHDGVRNEVTEFQSRKRDTWMTNLKDHKKTFRPVVAPKKRNPCR